MLLNVQSTVRYGMEGERTSTACSTARSTAPQNQIHDRQRERLGSCHHYCQCLPTSDDRYSYSFNESWIQLQYKCLTIISILDPSCDAPRETLLSLQRSIPVEERLDLRRTDAGKQTSKHDPNLQRFG